MAPLLHWHRTADAAVRHLCLSSIVYQHQFIYGERYEPISTDGCTAIPPAQDYGYTARTMAFPVMNLRNSLKNLAGVVGGLALLAVGARALVYSATTIANLTGTIQASWAATLISFGFCLPAGRSTGAPLRLDLEAVRRPLPLLPC